MFDLNFLKNQKIAILGFGVNNEKLVGFLLKNRLPITICDQDGTKNVKPPRYSANKLVSWRLGKNYLNNLTDFDIVFRSPGIPYLNQKIQQAKKNGVKISSQTKLFFELCPAKIIGVTGTKGKGTTSTLIYEILKRSGKKVFLAGNIGKDPFNYLEKLKTTDIIVLELSSFQLQDLDKSPSIAVVLNITVDHLDRHKDRKEYLEAKKAITKFQIKNDFVVVNADYQDSKNFTKISKSKNLYFSIKRKVRAGSYYKDEWLWLADDRHRVRCRTSWRVCRQKDIKLLGKHNLENVAAATTASFAAGASMNAIKKVLKTFKGLEHRLEYIGSIRGIKYYNDSFSTTPRTAIAAINSFDQPTVLIAGGSDKGADFNLLAQEIIDNRIKAAILIGDMAKKILNALLRLKSFNIDIRIIKSGTTWNLSSPARSVRRIDGRRTGGDVKDFNSEYCLSAIMGCKTMRQIIRTASNVAQKGDVVLLSPACASFDMFRNYKERGEVFKKEMRNLKF